MTGTASRIETRAAIRNRLRDYRDRSDIDDFIERCGVLMYLAGALAVVLVISLLPGLGAW